MTIQINFSSRPNYVLPLNLLLASLAMLIMGLVKSFGLCCLLIAISGAAQAPLWPACIKIITNHVDSKSFGIVVGLLGTAPYAGATFSAAFVSYLTDLYGWRHSLLPIFVPCTIVSILVFVAMPNGSLKNDSSAKKSNNDRISFKKIATIKYDYGVSLILKIV